MGTKYSTQSISGYNSSPPADDGTVAESNRVKHSTTKTKLADPIKVLAEAINTALVNYVDIGPTAVNSGYTTTATDYGSTKIISTSGASPTLELLALASCPDGYHVFLHNEFVDGNNDVTVSVDGSGSFSAVPTGLPAQTSKSTEVLLTVGSTICFQISDDKSYYLLRSASTVSGVEP